MPLPTLPQGHNRVKDFIPVARIAELLLHPGQAYTYKGETRHYADIRLVYWAGGNPFHHHQDLRRLREAFSRPDTVIVHDSVRTATAAHADIVFPITLSMERDDIGAAANDPFLVPMRQLATPYGQARDDYAVFSALAERLGCAADFTEGLDSHGWQQRIYQRTRNALAEQGWPAPDFAAFMAGEVLELPLSTQPGRMARFHADPERQPLDTPSGRIELWSEVVARSELPGHPAWVAPQEWLGAEAAQQHRFQLVANQPKTRLHSQLDFGAHSMAGKQVRPRSGAPQSGGCH
ncbi:MAG: molybdopterin-dependent oxidoreductase [Thiolinea sp.]